MDKTLIFDVGNVLIQWDARLVYHGHFDEDAAIDAFFEEVGFQAWNLEQDRGRTWKEGVAALSALYPHHAELIEAFDRRWHESVPGVVEGMPELLAELGAQGVPLYAITNFSAEKWDDTCVRFPFLATSFRDVVVSAHARLVKPDPAIFRLCLERNGLVPGDCVFIDDSAANCAAARDVGIDAIEFAGTAALAEALRARGISV